MCQAISNTNQPRKKSVSFAKDPNNRRAVKVQVKFIDTKLAVTDEQKSMMFYSQKEKQRMQQSARKVATQVSMQDRCNYYNNEMSHVHNYEFDYCPILLRAFRSCNRKCEQLTDEERHYLTEWMIYGDNRRGLERFSVIKLNASMHKRKKRAIATVLKMQAEAATNGSPNSDEWIAAVYREFSAQSKRFATLMGQVDEGAAMKGVKIDEYAGYLPKSPTALLNERRGSF